MALDFFDSLKCNLYFIEIECYGNYLLTKGCCQIPKHSHCFPRKKWLLISTSFSLFCVSVRGFWDSAITINDDLRFKYGKDGY